MLTWISILIILWSVSAAEVLKSNITLGSVNITDQEIGSVYQISVIAKNLRIPVSGQIRRFRVNIGSNISEMDMHLQAWRLDKGNVFNLTRTKRFTRMVPGINEVDIRWYLPAGDFIGVSCNGYCPLRRSKSSSLYKSKVSMGDRPTNFTKRSSKTFDDYDLMGQLAIELVFEVTGLPPMETTPIPFPTSTASTNQPTSQSSGKASGTTTLKGIDNPQSQSDETGMIGVWWILIIACVLVVFLAVALVIVGACSWRRERGALKKQLLNGQSRPTFTSSENDGPLSAGGSNFNTLSRDNRGLQSLNEIEVLNERQRVGHRGVVASVSPPAERPVGQGQVTVTFDNGNTNDSFILPPPPLTMPPNDL